MKLLTCPLLQWQAVLPLHTVGADCMLKNGKEHSFPKLVTENPPTVVFMKTMKS